MTLIPEPLDDDGTLNIHASGSLAAIPITLQDGEGRVEDASTAPLFFECGQLRKALPLDPAQPRGRLLSLNTQECADLKTGDRWVIFDESNGARTPLVMGRVDRFN